ncbi:Protein N-acetyltransferase, RimJ/RimL family [Fictibacillus solisalsi]|uniref:Protein N-acetyltransferase, RimJ/RimL family n=1 Tax=Fictibacillus solisalsi TaxID=459525 RepID=A0A1G9YC27_9BACL|nr:GNAT family protein [Fictibacillus solisalsi]SDN06629.1 Protein N-acetyltransferase, RimJ/RimL family [Fictibacillus solisalsi]
MLTPVTLYGSLVCLEPMKIEHIPDLCEAASENRSTYAYTSVPNGIEETKYYIDKALTAYSKGRELPFVVRHIETGRIVGTTRFLDLEAFSWPPPWPPGVGVGALPKDTNPPTVAEIGSTWYAHSVQRTGVNTECKLLMLAHAFNVWHTIRVTLKTDARNARSRSAIQRLGATFEGIRRAHVPANDGSVRDTAYYSILREEWPLVCKNLQERLRRGISSKTK